MAWINENINDELHEKVKKKKGRGKTWTELIEELFKKYLKNEKEK